MALPSSGPISLEMIRLTYGGSLPARLTDYYRGGPHVPDTPSNASVPTSGPISLTQFYGAGGSTPFVALKSGDASGSVFIPEPPTAPASHTVASNVVTINVAGGSGSYTCTWSHLSGDAGIGNPGANQFAVSFSASVDKNSSRSAIKRCAASDGVSTINVDVSVNLDYTAGA